MSSQRRGRFRRTPAAAALAVLLAGPTAAAAAGGSCLGAGIVFAVDASGSVDDGEYALQLGGLAHALSDPAVLATIASEGGIAAAAVVWSDTAVGTTVLPWRPVRSAADAAAFGHDLTSIARIGTGNTDLGVGIAAALDLFDPAAPCVIRRVVDVSGDGRESLAPRHRSGHSVLAARERARAMGVVVNGLAVVSDEADLADYYRAAVATGPGSFVVTAGGFEDFAVAMREKLIREISPPKLTALDDPAHRAETP